jgi:hypothetical protein
MKQVANTGIGLDDDQGLLPRAQLAGQENNESTVAPGELRALYLPPEHDQLLAQESILEDQF